MPMHKDIISFFSFPFITENVRMGKSWRRMSYAHRGRRYGSSVKPLCLFALRVECNIPDANVNSCGHISSNMLLTHCTWTPLLLAIHRRNLHQIFPGEYLRPVYFRYQMHFLLLLLLMSDFLIAIHSHNLCNIFAGENLCPAYFRY